MAGSVTVMGSTPFSQVEDLMENEAGDLKKFIRLIDTIDYARRKLDIALLNPEEYTLRDVRGYLMSIRNLTEVACDFLPKEA